MTGSDSSRMLSNIFFGSVEAVAAGDEDRDDRFVEGLEECEQRPDQDARAAPATSPRRRSQRAGAGAHGGALEVAIEPLERRREDQEDDRNRQYAWAMTMPT